jgi:hypothetical protein
VPVLFWVVAMVCLLRWGGMLLLCLQISTNTANVQALCPEFSIGVRQA